VEAPSASALPPSKEETLVTTRVVGWNAALSGRDAHTLGLLYAPSVLYYGKRVSAAEREKLVAGFFAKTPDYAQSVRDLHIEDNDAGTATLARFMKKSTAHGKTTEYPSYLVFDASGHIVEESDLVTDENLRKLQMKRATAQDSKPTTCDWALNLVDSWVAQSRRLDYPPNSPGFAVAYLIDGRHCMALHGFVLDDPATGAGHSPRMASWCVDSAGATATGGWSMMDSVDHDVPIDVPANLRADVKRLCTAGIPDPQSP
jgi:hypothetical protein